MFLKFLLARTWN